MACSPSAPAFAIKAAAAFASVPVVARRGPVTAVHRAASGVRARRGAVLVASGAVDGHHRPAIDELIDGDLRAYLESQITTTGEMSPTARLIDVMSRPVEVATPEQRLAEVDAFFAAEKYSGLPVVDDEGRCVGVVSKKDKDKASNGVSSVLTSISLFLCCLCMH
ncbi:hypothetical protein HU200_067751 [Digitaria exilis]|uniref:CBS domain-containing protein n=1 Tax=Digitaria exilis TaxID=1010633 RepID=A0A835A5F2_9POAL|nr:hypothetical protein HU200_067751 [Digitaria exilis]